MGPVAFSRQPDIHKEAMNRANKILKILDRPDFLISIAQPHYFQWKTKLLQLTAIEIDICSST